MLPRPTGTNRSQYRSASVSCAFQTDPEKSWLARLRAGEI